MLAEFYELEEERDSLVCKAEELEGELELACTEAEDERAKVVLATSLMRTRTVPLAFKLFFMVEAPHFVGSYLVEHLRKSSCTYPCPWCMQQRWLVELIVEAVLSSNKNA